MDLEIKIFNIQDNLDNWMKLQRKLAEFNSSF